MKKIFSILAAAMTALILASCAKEVAAEPVPSTEEGLIIDIDVPDMDGDTKAIKKTWNIGDKLNIWFDGAYWNQRPQLVLTFTGRKWVASQMDESILKEAGKFNVIYEASNSEFTAARNSNYYYFPDKIVTISGSSGRSFYSVPVSCYQNGVEYTYSNYKLTAKISGWRFLTMIQVVITGLEKSADNYALKINNVSNTAAYYFNATNGTVIGSAQTTGGYSVGVPNKDGVAFCFASNSKPESRDIVFTLKERLSQEEHTYTKPATSLATSTTRIKAIKIDGHKFFDPGYVEIGGSKWATKNLGATTIAGSPSTCFGDYYAWGETEPRYTGIHITELNRATFDGWKTAHPDGYSSSDKPTYIADKLDAAHDPAIKVLGSGWHTPTRAEYEALYKACGGTGIEFGIDSRFEPGNRERRLPLGTSETTAKGIYWCDDYSGIPGILFSDGNNQLFFPAAGSILDKGKTSNYNPATGMLDGGTRLYYWESEMTFPGNTTATEFFAEQCYISVMLGHTNRYRGMTIRPVKD